MRLDSFGHKGLRQLYRDGNPKGVPSEMADKLRKLLLALETAANLDQLDRFPDGSCILLKAARKGCGVSRLPETGESFFTTTKSPMPLTILN